MGVVRLNSTDSSKGNSSPAQIIAASPTALATATQVGVGRVYQVVKSEIKIYISLRGDKDCMDKFCGLILDHWITKEFVYISFSYHGSQISGYLILLCCFCTKKQEWYNSLKVSESGIRSVLSMHEKCHVC